MRTYRAAWMQGPPPGQPVDWSAEMEALVAELYLDLLREQRAQAAMEASRLAGDSLERQAEILGRVRRADEVSKWADTPAADWPSDED